MENFARLITQPEMIIVFVSIILLVALRPLYQAIFSIGMVNRDLDIATNVLTQLGRNQQDEFYNQFKTINSQIQKIAGLRHAWREFVDSMYFENANFQNIHKKAFISHRPLHYFNRDSVLGTRLNLSQFLAYPNYLIGIGLTFTFIGLAAALHVAQAGLANGAGQQALKDLLAVASIKFISSIAGISSSLVISALQRLRIRIFQQKLETFCDLLEECTKYKSTEKLLHDSFNEQRTQTAIFNDMAKSIATAINDMINNQLSTSVEHAFEPLAQEIRSLAQNFSEGSENALSKMLTEFLSELHKRSDNEMQGMIDSIMVLKKSLDGLAVTMRSAGKNFDTDIKASSDHLAEMLKNFAVSFAPMGELLTSLSQSLSKVEETALNLREASGTIAIAAEGFKNSAVMIEHSEGKFNQEMRIFETSAQGISGAIATLERTSQQADDAAIILKNQNSYFSQLKSKWLK